MSGNAGGNKQENSIFHGTRRIFVDQIKEDGIRKEMYKNERKSQENWIKKWGFLQNPRKLWEKEAEKAGLPYDGDILHKKNTNKDSYSRFELYQPKNKQTISEQFPVLSSEIIGWRLRSKKHKLNPLERPMYSNRKRTMNPPLSSEEPDLRYQRVIFLG